MIFLGLILENKHFQTTTTSGSWHQKEDGHKNKDQKRRLARAVFDEIYVKNGFHIKGLPSGPLLGALLEHKLHFKDQDDPKSSTRASKKHPAAVKSEPKHAKMNPGKNAQFSPGLLEAILGSKWDQKVTQNRKKR